MRRITTAIGSFGLFVLLVSCVACSTGPVALAVKNLVRELGPAERQFPALSKDLDRGDYRALAAAVARSSDRLSAGEAKTNLKVVEEQAGELYEEAICVGIAQLKGQPDYATMPGPEAWKRFVEAYVTAMFEERTKTLSDQNRVLSRANGVVTTLELYKVNPGIARIYFNECVLRFPSMKGD